MALALKCYHPLSTLAAALQPRRDRIAASCSTSQRSSTMALKSAAARAVPRLEQGTTALFLCDVQERFAKAIDSFDHMVGASTKLLKGAGILQLPVYVTEQAPKGASDVFDGAGRARERRMAEETAAEGETSPSLLAPLWKLLARRYRRSKTSCRKARHACPSRASAWCCHLGRLMRFWRNTRSRMS